MAAVLFVSAATICQFHASTSAIKKRLNTAGARLTEFKCYNYKFGSLE
jgi:hypothetical protein